MPDTIPTTRLNLDRTFTFHGTLYGPGAVDVPNKINVGPDEEHHVYLYPADGIRDAQKKAIDRDIKAGRIPSPPAEEVEMQYKRTPPPPENFEQPVQPPKPQQQQPTQPPKK